MDAGVITAIGGLLVVLGGGIRFIWVKIERRFRHIETALEACQSRDTTHRTLISELISALQLLVTELHGSDPTNPHLANIRTVLARAYRITKTPADMIDKLGEMR